MNYAVNILGPRGGIIQSFKFNDETAAVRKQTELETETFHAVEFVDLNFFPKRCK